MLHRLLPLALMAVLAGCATTADEPVCPAAAAGSVYLDIVEFQQGLNDATRHLDGEWSAGLVPIFKRLDKVVASRERLAAEQPEACRGAYVAETLRLRSVRSRGEQFVAKVRLHLENNASAFRTLAKRVPVEARLGDLRLRLVRIDEAGERFWFRAHNLSRKKTHSLVTHRLLDIAGSDRPLPRPAYFVLSDDLANVYRLTDISPATTERGPVLLRPGGEQEIVVRFAGPYFAPATKLTLQVDASLVPTDPKHGHRSPAVLVLPKQLLPLAEPPVFIAEPGRL